MCGREFVRARTVGIRTEHAHERRDIAEFFQVDDGVDHVVDGHGIGFQCRGQRRMLRERTGNLRGGCACASRRCAALALRQPSYLNGAWPAT